ncbi:peptidyl-tRNA hydrolase [Corynebacterium kroppenstedtii]|uniref:peptidyl-tRNA hydrolase n=1 Tax=Corynebacterium sp. PCR 32 TaxID=3351342 RepID=UPI003099F749
MSKGTPYGDWSYDGSELFRGRVPSSIAHSHGRLASLRHNTTNAHEGEDLNHPSTVQAMPLVLKMPRSALPPRRDLLEATALASILVCLDPRAGYDETWMTPLAQWYGARIRKIARRARTPGQWARVQDIPGMTVTIGESSARAFLPGPVRDIDPRIGKLQISGTDLPPHDDQQNIGASIKESVYPVIAINTDLEMSVGKAAAQVGHAAMLWAAHATYSTVEQWLREPRFTVVESSSHDLDDAVRRRGAGQSVEIIDAGFTEVMPGSRTAVVFNPAL